MPSVPIEQPKPAGQAQVTHAMEDYLKAVYRIQETGAQVTTQLLSEELGVTGPSVTNMIKRLHDLRLVRHSPYRGVELTQAGEKIALEVLRHHRLLELYLAESLGFPWDEVHAEAERLEHHVSDEFEARMDSFLGFPTTDPHGDPIPDRHLRLAPEGARRTIAELEPGERATVATVPDEDPALLRYLGELALVPARAIRAVGAAPFDGPVTLDTDSGRHAISRQLAATIVVT
jgi:DtxR family Mn-dependent transcriptional regulator